MGGVAGRGRDTTHGRWRVGGGGRVCGVLLAATLEVVLDAAVGHSPLTPGSPGIAGWLAGVGKAPELHRDWRAPRLPDVPDRAAELHRRVCGTAGAGGRLSTDRRAARWAIALVVALNVTVVAGPVLFSTDVFSYIAYARMGVQHGLDPYLHGPLAIEGDPIFKYVGGGLAQSGDGVRPAVHAALLPAGACSA